MARATRLALALTMLVLTAPAAPPRVESISPEGSVKAVRQVALRFSAAMAPLGDSRALPDAASVRCQPAAPGAGRWVGPSEWVYELDAPLPGAARCTVRLRAGLRTLAGERVGGRRSFAFDTGGPAVLAASLWPGWSQRAEEDARFVLRLDALPRVSEIERIAYLVDTVSAERTALRVVIGPERDAIVDAVTDAPRETDLVLAPTTRLASARAYELVWDRGISANGVRTRDAQRLPFRTRAAFALEPFCGAEGCDPSSSRLTLGLNAPVARGRVDGARLVPLGAHAQLAPRALEPQRDAHDQLLLAASGPFPQRSRWRAEPPPGLRDESGRLLGEDPVEITFGPYPSRARFRNLLAIAEPEGAAWGLDLHAAPPEARLREMHVPLARLRPAEQARTIASWLPLMQTRPPLASGGAERRLPTTPDDEPSTRVLLPIRGLGLHAAQLDGVGVGDRKGEIPFAVTHVTQLAVHLKASHDAALVWVTQLRDTAPVDDARVHLFGCGLTPLGSGKTEADGVVEFRGIDTRRGCERKTELLALAQRGGDVAFLSTPEVASDAGDWQASLDWWEPSPPPLVHLALARNLLRRGETLHAKLFARVPTLGGMQAPPREELAADEPLRVVHAGSEEEFETTLRWDANGNGLLEWAVPRDAPLGLYYFAELEESGASFRVEDFKPPLVSGTIMLSAGAEIARDKLPVDLSLAYLSGGPAADLAVELRIALFQRDAPRPKGFEEFRFDAGEPSSAGDDWRRDFLKPVAPWGTRQREESGWRDENAEEPPPPAARLTLDASGRARAELPLPRLEAAQTVLVEASFRDPNGATQTLAQRFDVWPAALSIGVTTDTPRDGENERVHARAVVLGHDGKPLAGVPVELEWVSQSESAAELRLPGGFTRPRRPEGRTERSALCRAASDAHGGVSCGGIAPSGDEVFVVARATDAAGRVAATHGSVEIDSWRMLDSRLALSADKTAYAPGEVARIEVKSAFEGATALVTIEREGIAERRIVALRGPSTLLELPLRPSFAPNVHVAVLALSGSRGPGAAPAVPRAPDAAAASISIDVTPSAYELDVSVATDRDEYRPGEPVKTQIRVRARDGAVLPSGAEVALAVVDEALLELAPNESWDLAAFLRAERPRSVLGLTTQPLAAEGAISAGSHAMPHLGGLALDSDAGAAAGGAEQIVVTANRRVSSLRDVPVSIGAMNLSGRAARERFDSLVLWRGAVALGASGEGELEIPLNDLLTRLRIVALASAGVDRFGTGSASIRTTQPLQIYSGVAPLAREGDRAEVEFTLRNAGDEPLTLAAQLALEGSDARFAPRRLALAPGEAKAVTFTVDVPSGVESLVFDLSAAAKGGAVDRLRVAQRVLPSVPQRVLHAALLQLDGAATLPVMAPAGEQAARGGVDLSLRRSLAAGTTGIRTYFERYPYTCLEQEASIAVGLRDPARWRALTDSLASRLDAHGFAKFWTASPHGSDVLTAYLLSIASAAGYAIPLEERATMLSALEAFALGRVTPPSYVAAADLGVRKLAALAALARHKASEPALLAAMPSDHPELWPTSALLDALEVAARWPEVELPRARLLALLRARLQLGGTTLAFANEELDDLDWLLAGADVNAVRVALLALTTSELEAEAPRLLRGALARQQGGRWDTTPANAWGQLALEAFAAKLEGEAVTGETEAQLSGESARFAWPEGDDPPKRRLAWPPALTELRLRHAGTGRPWVEVQSVSALPLHEARFAGFRIARRWTPVEQRVPGLWSRGDVVRVQLELEALGSAAWVAISDPVPPGATHLGGGLGRDSALLTRGEGSARRRWDCPCVEQVERSFEAQREFYGFVPAGRWSTEYTLRLDQAGVFALPPTRIEAMYSPESFGELPHEPVTVAP
jgi:hypothetical protein